MLKEKITYKDELPINILVAEIEEYPIHFHDELEVVYILKGKVKLRNGYYSYELKQGDIFILNDREIHSFNRIDDEENLVMMVQLDLTYFSTYYKNLKNNFFVTDMEVDDDESLDVLSGILAKIMMEVLQKGYGYEHKVIESTHNLIASLQADFQYFLMEDGKFVNETKKKGNKILAGRLNRITDYMYDNFYRKLTLNEIAEREHLSIYYLSHVIKESTGLSFQDLLSFIRVEESEKLLLGTNKKIGVIAEEAGFSAVRYYIKHFETWFGMHPLEYRKKFTGKVSGRESPAQLRRCSPAEIEEAIREQVKGVYKDYVATRKNKPVIVDLDSEEEGMFKEPEDSPLSIIMERPVMKPVSGPYCLMKNLEENIIAMGSNYVVSSKEKYQGEISSLSILVYNFNDSLGNTLMKIDKTQSVYDQIRVYDESMELLVRCAGLSGEFSVSRYKVSRENSIMAFKQLLEKNDHVPTREIMIKKWTALPSVEFSTFSATDTLSLRSTLKGFSAELILVDKKTQQNSINI
ncbi:MAG: AraC family transcriptional regulator [Anaerovoracaceae bacterium]